MLLKGPCVAPVGHYRACCDAHARRGIEGIWKLVRKGWLSELTSGAKKRCLGQARIGADLVLAIVRDRQKE